MQVLNLAKPVHRSKIKGTVSANIIKVSKAKPLGVAHGFEYVSVSKYSEIIPRSSANYCDSSKPGFSGLVSEFKGHLNSRSFVLHDDLLGQRVLFLGEKHVVHFFRNGGNVYADIKSLRPVSDPVETGLRYSIPISDRIVLKITGQGFISRLKKFFPLK